MIDKKSRLSVDDAERLIKEKAQVTENIIFGTHAMERQEERGIDDIDVLRVLRHGHIDDLPELTKQNDWLCKIVYRLRGSRSAGVVVILLQDGKLFIKTVEWEDI